MNHFCILGCGAHMRKNSSRCAQMALFTSGLATLPLLSFLISSLCLFSFSTLAFHYNFAGNRTIGEPDKKKKGMYCSTLPKHACVHIFTTGSCCALLFGQIAAKLALFYVNASKKQQNKKKTMSINLVRFLIPSNVEVLQPEPK